MELLNSFQRSSIFCLVFGVLTYKLPFYYAAIFRIIYLSLCTYYLGLMACLISSRNTEQAKILDSWNRTDPRCRIAFWLLWILTRRVLIQWAVIRSQRIFHVDLRPPPPPRQGVCLLRPLPRIKFGPPLNCDPGSSFHVQLTPVMIQR